MLIRSTMSYRLHFASAITTLLVTVACSQSNAEPEATGTAGEGSGNNSGSSGSTDTTTRSATIGTEGGMVSGPNGTRVTIPEGALDEDVEVSISVASNGFSQLPALANGAIYAFEPHGQQFNEPVTIRIPHTGNPAELALYTSEPGDDWTKLHAELDTSFATIEVSHFSFFFNGREVCGLARQECCTPADGGDGECSGALLCLQDICVECGFNMDRCCAGNTCIEDGLTCANSVCGRQAPDTDPPDDGTGGTPPPPPGSGGS